VVDILMDKIATAAEKDGLMDVAEGQLEKLYSGLAARVWTQWQANVQHRQDAVDADLEACHLMRAARYPDAKKAMIEQSGGEAVYAPLAAMQSISGAASVSQVTLPAAERAWSLSPTPIPDLPEENRKLVDQQLNADAMIRPLPEQTGRKTELVTAQMKKLEREAGVACKRMEQKIADQLVESGFYGALSEFIEDFATYPYAVLQRVTVEEPTLRWKGGKPKRVNLIKDVDLRVSPFDVFWAPGMVGVNDGPWIHRMRLRDYELARCRGPGYIAEAVDKILENPPTGGWLWSWQDASRNDVEQNYRLNSTDKGTLIDVLSCWMQVKGSDLAEYGVEDVEDNEYYDTNVWLCGNEVLRVVRNTHPLDHRPYYKASWRSIPGQFHGSSPPLQVKHLEDICNASMRALVKNMGIAAGPQVVIAIDQLPKGEESITSVYPLKVWQVVSKPGATQEPIKFFQPSSNAKELIGVFQHYWELAGDVTGIYRWNYGADQGMQGAAQTMNGLSMLLENSSKVIRHAVENLEEGVVVRRIYDQFLLNMLYDTDVSVKGDISVVARGSSSLIERAAIRQRRIELLNAIQNTPETQIPGMDGIIEQIRLAILTETAKDLDIESDRFPEEEEIMQLLAEYRKMKQNQQAPKDPRVEAAQIAYNSRIEDQKLEMEDREKQRDHVIKVEQMRLTGIQSQMEKSGQSKFEAEKTKMTKDVLTLKQKDRHFNAELQLKQEGKTGL